MKCSKCGARLSKDARVCKKCGAVQELEQPFEPIPNDVDMDLPELAEVVVSDASSVRPRYVNKALIFSILFVVAVLSVVIYFYTETTLVDLPDEEEASVSVKTTFAEEKNMLLSPMKRLNF